MVDESVVPSDTVSAAIPIIGVLGGTVVIVVVVAVVVVVVVVVVRVDGMSDIVLVMQQQMVVKTRADCKTHKEWLYKLPGKHRMTVI
jgi:hypothetical protein